MNRYAIALPPDLSDSAVKLDSAVSRFYPRRGYVNVNGVNMG